MTATGVLPISWQRANTASNTSCEVLCPLMISTSFITVAGLKKCMPITWQGLEIAAAMPVMDSEDVLVAMMVSGLHMPSSILKSSIFRSISSTAASMIRSESAMSL